MRRSGWVLAGVAVVALIAAGVIFWPSGSDLGGSTGGAIAKRVEQECGASTRERRSPNETLAPTFASQADEVVFITCPEGEVNPFADLFRFSSAAALNQALQASRAKVDQSVLCVARAEAIYGDFRDFAGLCRELGGRLRCPAACRERIRAHRIPPIPAQAG